MCDGTEKENGRSHTWRKLKRSTCHVEGKNEADPTGQVSISAHITYLQNVTLQDGTCAAFYGYVDVFRTFGGQLPIGKNNFPVGLVTHQLLRTSLYSLFPCVCSNCTIVLTGRDDPT